MSEVTRPDWCGERLCPSCEKEQLRPEHAHYKCDGCGYRGACCW